MYPLVNPKNVRRLDFAAIVLTLIKICLLTTSAFSWDGNYLMIDDKGQSASKLSYFTHLFTTKEIAMETHLKFGIFCPMERNMFHRDE